MKQTPPAHIERRLLTLPRLLTIALLIVLAPFARRSFGAASSPLDELKAGEWYEVPDSHLKAVAISEKQFPWLRGNIGGIIDCWAGGAFDTQRDRLYIGPAGGHAGYNGNEVYAFDLNDLKWHRLNDPDPVIPGTEYTDLNKAPFAMHTYDAVEYLPPPVDRYLVIGGWGTPRTYAMDPDHPDHWEVYPDHGTGRTGDLGAYDPVGQRYWLSTPSNTGKLSEFDPIAHQWTRRLNNSPEPSYYETADIDWKRRLLVSCGKGKLKTWSLSATLSAIVARELKTTGDSSVIDAPSPGFCYVPGLNGFVGWSNGANVCTLDIDSLKWTTHPPAATNRTIPGPAQQWGTFGRFRYVPSRNVFILCSSVDQNVFIYRLTDDKPNLLTSVEAKVLHEQIDSDLPTPALKVSAHYADGSTKDVTADASYESLDPTILQADLHSGGTVRGLAAGAASVRATYTDPSLRRGFSALIKLQVRDVLADSKLEAVKLDEPVLMVPAGDDATLQLISTYSRGDKRFTRTMSPSTAWTSDHPEIASVDHGIVHALKPGGPVRITATLGKLTDTAQVTVTAEPTIHRIAFQVKPEPAQPGWQVDCGEAYTDTRGYGWLDPAGLDKRDDRHSAVNPLLMHFVRSPNNHFKLMLPPGNYHLRIAMGDHDYPCEPFSQWTAQGDTKLVYDQGTGNIVATKTVHVDQNGLVLTVTGSINYLVAAPVGVDLDKYADDVKQTK